MLAAGDGVYDYNLELHRQINTLLIRSFVFGAWISLISIESLYNLCTVKLFFRARLEVSLARQINML